MKKNYDFNNEDFLKLDYKNTHLLKKFINENGKIIPRIDRIDKNIFFSKLLKDLKYKPKTKFKQQ